MKVDQFLSKWWVRALVVLAAFVIFKLGAIFDHLSLSLLANSVLRDSLRSDRSGAFAEPFSTLSPTRSPYCASAPLQIGSGSASSLADASRQRLVRDISLACENDGEIISRFDNEIAAGYIPTAVDALYVGEVLARTGNLDRAMQVWRTAPIVSVWYVGLGRIAIEQAHDEPAAFAYFRLANTIDPSFSVQKEPMYRYLCLASVRDNKVYVLDDPCEDFDRVKSTSTSRLYLGRSAYNRGDFLQALSDLSDAIAAGDVSGDAYYWKGKTFAALGNTAEAEAVYRAGTAQVPSYPWNYLELAQLKANAGCYLAARDYLNRMQAINTEDAIAAAQRMLQIIDRYTNDAPSCR